jgi:hypothetical protein
MLGEALLSSELLRRGPSGRVAVSSMSCNPPLCRRFP